MLVTPSAPVNAKTQAATGWDSRLVVIHGETRSELLARALALVCQPAPPLDELASTQAAELQPGGARLTVVATSTADLHAKLRRAADRLADPGCRQIRDTAGVYYFDQPLYPDGSLALLFPGEGAQYPNMLRDLCGIFPQVDETFAWCDQLAAESRRPSLRPILHPAPEQLAEAEAELRQLGPSIFGVLLADFAITRVLSDLALPVSATAGHSAGELAALLAAGAIPDGAIFGPKIVDIMDLMQRLEQQAEGVDVALLAVGAGKATVSEAAAAVAGGAVVVAMDNCPHQCVAVGPSDQISGVEATLLSRGLVCERLPFRRPYHTPMFEPWMRPFRELFADIPFQRPHTPVYCCSTGKLFPNDPDTIRELTVNHWVSPVEFTRMIETMHTDGVRLFVEAGPRGNLSAFVEDVLRGRRFAAIPANVARRSGPTQINHLVAQLVAHHVPINLGCLYGLPASEGRQPPEGVSTEVLTPLTPQVIDGYLTTMERFLDVQREVMEAFLADRSKHGVIPPELCEFPDIDTSLISPSPTHPSKLFALVGEVIRHEPGHSIAFRRPLDLREDLYADDHTLGGRGVSRVDPSQNGLPVLPMTFSLEAMAEAASILVPGKVVVAIRNVRLFRWVPFDPEPTTFEVRATVVQVDPGTGIVEVKADTRDLGNSFLPNGANKPAAEAVIVLADRYPDPPQPQPFRLTDEQKCASSVDDLRRNMFHGPLFQMIRSLDRTGREGIEGTLEVQDRKRWLRSHPDPHVVLDPVLTDAAMHILGAWHLEQPDWSGRILLPIGVQEVEYFGPPPEPGTRMIVRGHNEKETARQVRHGVELFYPDGRVWLRMTGAEYWRFYLPFGDVNFFGPKDQYFLSIRWPEVEPPCTAPVRCYFLDPPLDLQQPVLRASGVRVTMTPREIAQFQALNSTDAERSEWFFTRLVAKDAVRAALNERYGIGIFPADIETDVIEGRIVCRSRGDTGELRYPTVAVAVLNGKVAAFAAFSEQVGIALQSAVVGVREVARLAVADALRIPANDLIVEPGSESNHYQVLYAGRRFTVRTASRNELIVATALGEAESG